MPCPSLVLRDKNGRFLKGFKHTEERKAYLRTLKGEKSPAWRGGKMKPKNCIDCGKTIGHRSTRCPSCINQGEAHSQWKGGRIKRGGYILIRCENHPRAKHAGRYIREHNLVMEKHLGRYLQKGEVVHHINSIKDDNRLENLQLMTRSEHMRLHTKGRTRKGRILKSQLS